MTASGLWLSIAATLVVTPLYAQQQVTHTSGAVVRPVGVDTVPVPSVMVTLHRVGRTVQGPIDSIRADSRGRFSFAFPNDTTANFLLSARYADIAYFSTPISSNKQVPDTGLKLVVYDTSSAAGVTARSRTLVVSLPDVAGRRTVVDWIVLDNRGTVTRIAPVGGATWSAPLPSGASKPEVGDARLTQFSPEAVRFRGDSVFLDAPLSPGKKELFVQYQFGPERRTFSLDLAGVDSVDVLLEDPKGEVESPGWIARDSQRIEGRSLRRYSHPGSPPREVTVRFPGSPIPPRLLLPWFVAGFAVMAAATWWWAARRRRAPVARPAAMPSAVELADRIAALDLAHAGTQAELDGERWVAYQRERAALKSALDAALAPLRRGT
ncbi:MAG: hypothetical protein ABI647_08850 [Gemmatimonadota bacterium]